MPKPTDFDIDADLEDEWTPGGAAEAMAELGAMLIRPSVARSKLARKRIKSLLASPAVFREASANSKLAPVEYLGAHGSPRAAGYGAPVCSSTYVSIDATCGPCQWKGRGCYIQTGFTKMLSARLDRAARRLTPEEVIAAEVRLIAAAFHGGMVPQDGARGGRDLRVHVGGDVGSEMGARMLAVMALNWRRRGGGTVWTYTRFWRSIPRAAWGPAISVLASVDSPAEAAEAIRRGYAPAIVVAQHKSRKAAQLDGWRGRFIPCPAETGKATCVECRLCLDRDLVGLKRGIAFAAHGSGAAKMAEKLITLRRR